jgi:hypothetical protein
VIDGNARRMWYADVWRTGAAICRHRAEEALTLAAQTQDDWERELFQRIATQWQCLVVHKKGKEENTSEASPR